MKKLESTMKESYLNIQQVVGVMKQELISVINKKSYKTEVVKLLQQKVNKGWLSDCFDCRLCKLNKLICG